MNNGDGFVFSQILRGKKGQRYNEKLFDESGWTSNEGNTYRYKLFKEEYEGKDKVRKKETRIRKVLLYWNKAEADMARRKREEKLEKAARSVKNNAYGIKKGVDEYTKEDIADLDTGEILKNMKKLRSVDLKKAEQDKMYDGYFCIITSELDHDERKMRRVYGGLWRIEQSFRIMKRDLYARPVFVSKNEHIRAHFLICFVALLVIRIIQHRMGEKALLVERITRALNAATCHALKGGIILQVSNITSDYGKLIFNSSGFILELILKPHDMVTVLLDSGFKFLLSGFQSIKSLCKFGVHFFH